MKEDRLLFQIKTLEKMIFRTFIEKDEDFDRKKVPTSTQMQIMEHILLHKDEEIYQKDLEKILNLRRATVSGVLQTMEKNGLIERVSDNDDARTKKIILNPKAKELFIEKEKQIDKIENIIIKDISEDELKVFQMVLEKMKSNIKKESKSCYKKKGE